MSKPLAYFTICFTLAVLAFSTWQLFCGNFSAAFSALPFLFIIYLFVRAGQRRSSNEPPATGP